MSEYENKITKDHYTPPGPSNEPSDRPVPPSPSPASPPAPAYEKPASLGGSRPRDPVPPRAQRDRQR